MNTASLQRASSDPSRDDSSTVAHELARIRAEAPPDVECGRVGVHDDVEESPIARLMLAHSRVRISVTKAPQARSESATLPITILTTDATFASQLRTAVDPARNVQIVASEDLAAELAASGRCPILVTDNSVSRSALAAFAARLRAHDPSTVIVISGDRDQGGAFIGLQSSGIVDGFLLKPVTAGAAQLVLEAATRRHRNPAIAAPTHRSSDAARSNAPVAVVKADLEAAPTLEAHVRPMIALDAAPVAEAHSTPPRRSIVRASWSLAAVGVLVAGVAWWLTTERGIDASALSAKHLALADDAYAEGRLVGARDGAVHHYQTVLAVNPQNLAAHRGLDRVAAELSRNAQAHMEKKDLPGAVLTLQRLRELQPDYPELPLLDAQLRSLQDAVVASHLVATTASQEAAAAKPVRAAVSSRTAERQRATPETEKSPELADTSIEPTRPQEIRSTPAPSTAARLPSESVALSDTQSSIPAGSMIPSEPNVQAAIDEAAPATQLASVPSASVPASTSPQAVALEAVALAPMAKSEEPPLTTAVSAPELVKYVPPTYPSEAFARAMEGWIQVGMEISPAGDVINPRIEDGEKRQLFGRPALAAVRQWKYAPSANRTAGEQLSVRLEFKMESKR